MFNISFFLNNTKKNKSIINSKKFLFIFKFKNLQKKFLKSNGKSSLGSYTIYSKGGTAFNKYKLVDYNRLKVRLPAILVGNNFDNFRFCYIGLLKFINGSFSNIILPHKLSLGHLVITINYKPKLVSLLGFCIPLYSLGPKEKIFNIFDPIKKNGYYSRSAGTSSYIIRHTDQGVLIKLPSGKNKLFNEFSMATIGRSSNIYKKQEIITRFGYKKKLGWKSKVRGVAKNPCDHPHGGTTKGGKPKMNPWGKIFK